MIPNKNIFCNSPWYELHIYWDGSLSFCCHASPNLPYDKKDKSIYNIKNMSLAEWYKSQPMVESRKKMLGNIPWNENCLACYREEQVSNSSRRWRANQKSVIFKDNFEQSFLQSPNFESISNADSYDGLPVDLHIDLGNYCNLACKMCSQYASSKIASQMMQWGEIDSVATDWTKDAVTWKKFLNDLKNIRNLKSVHFMGGETVLHPKFKELLDFLISNNLTNISVSFVTNGTVFDQDLLDKLTKFFRVGIEISIESLSGSNSYVRQGTDTPAVIDNILRYKENISSDQHSVTLRPAPSILTIRDYHQVIRFALENKFLIKSVICGSPEFLDIRIFPDTIKKKYIKPYEEILRELNDVSDDFNALNESDPNNYKNIAKNQCLQAINLLSTEKKSDDKLFFDLCKHLSKWDKVYNLDARLEYPELSEILDNYGYQL